MNTNKERNYTNERKKKQQKCKMKRMCAVFFLFSCEEGVHKRVSFRYFAVVHQ